ncbi:carbohydrate ABC transporter permease [Candidatus Epulonipiscium viviparus]|uniref:carbohydrate ABC transporter permease n=1 Tax=Candidatus Epulonipiscium viviparus TaxID=420336 RepID=UPI000497A2A2|nr:carbohydrate ABC transporter permease [Candidatus Epulopiscium viviparus]
MDKTVSRPMKVLFYFLTIGYAFIALFPFFWAFYTSLRPSKEAYKLNFDFSNLSFGTYVDLIVKNDIGRWYFNSFIIAISVTLLGVILSTMAGYALARIDFTGKNIIFMTILGLMMIPGQITMIPQYMLLNKFNFINTYVGLIIPFLFNAFNIFMMRQFFISFPISLEEAAQLDGLSRRGIFFKIALPLAKPAITTIIIMTFMGSWNNFLMPNLLITSRDMYTLPVGMASLNSQYFSFPNQTMAGAMLLSIPMVILFLICQKYFIEGVTTSGIK